MEDELDAVSRGEEEWTTPLEKFWKPFIDQVDNIEKNVTREQVALARELGKDAATGKPVTVRMGRFGPFVQIGTKDDEEKPRFAGLRPGQKMDTINLATAMELFKLPRKLGKTADGEDIITNVGRFGPYVKYGSKYVSLKEDDPYEVTLERALEVIKLKQEADANRTIADFGADGDGIQVLNGRYGPYVTNGKKNAKIPKDRDPKTLTLEECRVLIEQAPERGAGRFGRVSAVNRLLLAMARRRRLMAKTAGRTPLPAPMVVARTGTGRPRRKGRGLARLLQLRLAPVRNQLLRKRRGPPVSRRARARQPTLPPRANRLRLRWLTSPRRTKHCQPHPRPRLASRQRIALVVRNESRHGCVRVPEGVARTSRPFAHRSIE